jgi:uncharacterized protein
MDTTPLSAEALNILLEQSEKLRKKFAYDEELAAANKCYELNDYVAAIKTYITLLEQSKDDALMTKLKKIIRDHGDTLKLSDTDMKWLQQQIDKNNSIAVGCLASLYDHGLGNLPRDEKKAMELYKKAADLGHVWIMYDLAFEFFDDGSEYLTEEEATNYLKRSAELGYKDSAELLKELQSIDL